MTSATQVPRSALRRAWRSPRAWVVLLGVLTVGLALDLGLKRWSFENVAEEPVVLSTHRIAQNRHIRIPRHDPLPVIPKLLNLHLVKNDGAVFGIGTNHRMFFIAFTFAALTGALVVFGRWTTSGASAAHAGIGLILAGGLGNLYDRLQYGVVRDFMHMLPGWNLPFDWHYPRTLGGGHEVFPWVFNAADVMLLFGMGILMFHMNRVEKRRKPAQSDAGRDSAEPAQPESA